MQDSFGLLLQQKNYFAYLTQRVRMHRLWKLANKWVRRLSRLLWIRRMISLATAAFLFLEQGILFLALFSLGLLLLPMLLLALFLQLLLHRHQYKRTDRAVLSFGRRDTPRVILWSCSKRESLHDAAFLVRCAQDFSKDGTKVILVAPKAMPKKLGQNVFIQDVPYFFHMRKRLANQTKVQSVILYE